MPSAGVGKANVKQSPLVNSLRRCGGAVYTMRRLGWSLPDPRRAAVWTTAGGADVDFNAVCPHNVRKLVRDSVWDWQMQQIARHQDIKQEEFKHGILLEPVKKYIQDASAPAIERGYVESVVTGGQWPQQRRYEASKLQRRPTMQVLLGTGNFGAQTPQLRSGPSRQSLQPMPVASAPLARKPFSAAAFAWRTVVAPSPAGLQVETGSP